MPELPEVHTTVTGLSKTIVGHKIVDVWTDYNSPYFKGSDTIKDPIYFKYFKKEILGKKIISVSRRAKNILIHLESSKKASVSDTILIHMKMTGHIMVGRYIFNKKLKKGSSGIWTPATDERKSLHDPYNRFIHFVISLSNGQQLVLSDTRKFAKVTLINYSMTNDAMMQSNESTHLKDLGPEPLEKSFTFNVFKERLNLKPNGRIKTVLMDPSVVVGIGNIYSDEALWRAGIHPETRVKDIDDALLKKLYSSALAVLRKGIDFGGDSMSDYRNVDGERGKFQEQHQVYRRKNEKCTMIIGGKRCKGIIQRKVVGGRSAHFCPIHQKLFI